MVGRQRDVGGQRLPDRFAVVPRLGQRQRVRIGLDAVGDLVQDHGPLGGGGLTPRRRRRVRGIQRLLDVGLVERGHLAERLAGDRRRVLEIAALDRRDPLAPDEVVVSGFERHQRPGGTRACEDGHQLDSSGHSIHAGCNTAHTTVGDHNGIHDIAAAQPSDDDPYLWLEEITGDEALDWVRARNEPTLADSSATTSSSRCAPRRSRCSTPMPGSPTCAAAASTSTTSGATRPTRAGCGGAPRWTATAPTPPTGMC